ncbi:MAG TPA: hypothetical protein VGE64_10200 [Xanthomonadaceae bacterium]|jgi:hypothetical protein
MTTATHPVSAEDIGQRVLKLIGSLRSAGDLSPERIQQETGLQVERSPDDRNVYGFSGDINDQWSYNLVTTPDRQDAPPRSLRFSFDADAHGDVDPAPICRPTFTEYTRALTELGFAGEPMRAYPGSDAWHFNRGDINVMAYRRGGEQGDCLSKLIVSASE